MRKYCAHNSNLAAPTKPIARHTPLRNRGGRQFKQTPEDKAFWKWMGERRPQPCDACTYPTCSRCHCIPRSGGGRDLDNLVYLCEDRHEIINGNPVGKPVRGCHSRQEKRCGAFCTETGVDLYAKARGHTAQWRKEGGS